MEQIPNRSSGIFIQSEKKSVRLIAWPIEFIKSVPVTAWPIEFNKEILLLCGDNAYDLNSAKGQFNEWQFQYFLMNKIKLPFSGYSKLP